MLRSCKYIRLCVLFCIAIIIGLSAFVPTIRAAENVEEDIYILYSGPTEYSDDVCILYEEETVAILAQINNKWSQIRTAAGDIGYCPNRLLQTTYRDTPELSEKAVTKQVTCLLASPDIYADITAILPTNLQVTKLAEDENGFSYVSLKNGRTGYLSSDILTPTSLSTAVIRPIPELKPHTGITTESGAEERLEELSEFFTAGRYWNDFEADTLSEENASFAISDTACQHENNGYSHCNYYTSPLCAPLGFSYGSQCLGYAGLLSDLVFGTEAPVTIHGDFEQIRIGDHIRLVLWDHSMLVTGTGKDENGKTFIYVTEVNADYETCRIDWDRKFTQDDLRRLGDYIEVHTRYPDT